MGRRTFVVAAVVVALVAVGAVVVVRSRGATDVLHTETGARRPNVLVIMTDDQTLESVRVMDNVKSRLMGEGTTFSSAYVSFPNCCPSRATYLTGQYAHNTGVKDNVPPLGGYTKLRADDTVALALQRSGYYTAHVGKYLNGWGSNGDITAPPGWDHWYGLIDPTTYRYFDYAVSDDGVRVDFGSDDGDYQTDVLGAEVVETIRAAPADKPWFVSFTPLAPHSEQLEGAANDAGTTTTTAPGAAEEFRWAAPKPAPRHQQQLAAKFPRGASFNNLGTGKPEAIASKPELTEGFQRLIDQGYQKELQTLLAVDEWIGTILDTLEETGQLDDTVIVFTSDNGFFHGEHRLAFQKYHLYEPSVHVPLVIRGGAFPKQGRVTQLAGNVDLAPTIYALAGVSPSVTVDGIDLAALATGDDPAPGRALLLENDSAGGRVHAEAIHTGRYVLIEHETGELELYDLQKDPEQLTNLAGDPAAASLLTNLQKRLAGLKECSGDTCRAGQQP